MNSCPGDGREQLRKAGFHPWNPVFITTREVIIILASSNAPTAEIIRLYQQGRLPSEIAIQFGITKSAVVSRLNRNHVLATRGRGGVKGQLKNPKVRTEDIVHALQDGLNYSQIAEQFGITRTGVVYRLKLAGCRLPVRRRKVKLPWDEIIALYVDEQRSLESIAEQFQIGVNTVSRGLKKRDVQVRSRTQHLKGTWAERKQMWEKAQRVLDAQFQKSEDTILRVTLAAGLSLQALSQRKMSRRLFPKQNVETAAYNSTKVFFSRHRAAIRNEMDRLRCLRDDERVKVTHEAEAALNV